MVMFCVNVVQMRRRMVHMFGEEGVVPPIAVVALAKPHAWAEKVYKSTSSGKKEGKEHRNGNSDDDAQVSFRERVVAPEEKECIREDRVEN